ncbi:MAG: ABC transporter permease [Hellea sp.]|nr:ABC transporter permease [Hellea sp.]
MGLTSFFSGFANRPLWWRLAWADMNQIYRRSLIGIFWISISFVMFIGVKIYIFGSFLGDELRMYSLWVTIGYAVWTFITHSITDGCTVFVSSRSWILGTNLSLGTFVAQNVMRHLIGFFMVIIISVILLIYLRYEQGWITLTIIPGFFFLILNSIWVHIVLGILCARFRDLLHLVRAIMHVMFFLTPILYLPKQLGPKAVIMNYNPFTHYLAIIREPIVNGRISELAWQVVIAITIAGWLLAIYLIKTRYRNIAFWI